MDIKFLPKENNEKFRVASEEYKFLWEGNKTKILYFIEKYSSLRFKINQIDALISDELSQSHPLTLRFNYPNEIKIGTLIHELIHILFVDNNIKVVKTINESVSLTVHKLLNLILYDIWSEVINKEFADQNMIIESTRNEMYKLAWEYALSMNKEERKKEYKKLILLYS